MENQDGFQEFKEKTKLLFGELRDEFKSGSISLKTLEALKEQLLPIFSSNAIKENPEELKKITEKLDNRDFTGVEAFFKKIYLASKEEE